MSKRELFRSLLAILLSALCLAGAGCVSARSIAADPNDPDSAYFSATPIVKAPRFELFPTQALLRPSRGLWIRKGDTVAARWHEFSFVHRKRNAQCGTYEFPNANCERCNACQTGDTLSYCSGPEIFQGFRPLRLFTFTGFMTEMVAGPPLEPATDAGCDEAGDGILLTPDSNVTYRLTLDPELLRNETSNEVGELAEARIHLVDGPTTRVKYELSTFPEAGPPSATRAFFSFTMPAGMGGLLEDNFSERVSIGMIRVLKGKPETDQVSGGLLLKDESTLKPSRIVFIPDFLPGVSYSDQDDLSCYGRYDAMPLMNGPFNMAECRGDKNLPDHVPFAATPVYLHEQRVPLLTWVVEFNQDDFADIGGGEMPMLSPSEVMAIEFTIK